jgi:hypothetical protein
MVNVSNSIDARGPRFGALITTIVLAVVLLTESIWLLSFQAFVFAVGAFFGPARAPYGLIYKSFVQKRLKSELVKEDAKPPQFAQFIGLLFALTALTGLVLEINILFLLATAMALIAAILNAFFDFCLGCQMYLIIKRLTTR